MTTQPSDPSVPAGAGTPAQDRNVLAALSPYRETGALLLLAANAAFLALAVLSLFLVFAEDARVTSFSGRADGQFGTYVGVVSIFFPLGAVLLTTLIKPPTPRGKLIATGALVEYAVSAVFGLVCLFASFVQTVGADYSGSIIDAFLTLLARLVWLVLLACAAFLVMRAFQTLYYVPRPKPAPVPPGYPQGYPNPGYQAAYGQSGAYPTVPGYPQGYPPQQQGYPQGYPQQPPQPPYPQSYPQQPYQPGYPTQVVPPRDDSATSAFGQTGWAAPTPPGTPAPPAGTDQVSGAPVSGTSVSGGPVSAAPASGAPDAPATAAESERTQLIQPAQQPPTEEHRDQPAAGRSPDEGEEPTQPWS